MLITFIINKSCTCLESSILIFIYLFKIYQQMVKVIKQFSVKSLSNVVLYSFIFKISLYRFCKKSSNRCSNKGSNHTQDG